MNAAVVACLLGCLSGLPLPAQYLLSVMAGYIHDAQGEVYLDEKSIAPDKTDLLHVQDGQRLRTADGNAEIMLDPNSYLRLGQNSEIQMIDAGLLSAQIGFHLGSIMVDLPYLVEDNAFQVSAKGGEVTFMDEGLYRLDHSDGTTTLRVIEGKASVETPQGSFRVKSKQALVLGGPDGPAKISKLESSEEDALSAWNQSRHERLSALAKEARREGGQGLDGAERALVEQLLRIPNPPPQPPPVRSGGGQR